jgi:F0F1-type ATP synthase membrane subunit b/b'
MATTATTQNKTAATKASTAGKKAATTRKRNATKTAARQAAPVVPATPVERAQAYAEKAVLIPVGAALVARERVVATADDLRASYGTRQAAEKQLKRYERRGTTARNRVEREVKKARTRVERELRTRRTRVERDVKRNRTRVERELKAFRRDVEKQLKATRKDVTARTELVTARVENIVAQANKTGSEVANTVVERVSALS